jgi:cellulose synthase/poly-beta-1,6-N-acetylglucosamine synthase-like glycosyltransferase
MITIGCPCQNNEKTMYQYLKSILNLDYPRDEIKLAFLLNNSTDNTYNILKEFQKDFNDLYQKITIWDICGINYGYIDSRNAARDYTFFANIRNLWLNMIDPDSEWIFSVDSDILLQPDALRKLMSHNVDMVSALVLNNAHGNWNNYNIQRWNGLRYCSITDIDYEFKNGLIPVDITGACSLMKHEAIKGIKYCFHKQGEDHGFCIRLKKNGCNIYCDTTVRTTHLR